MRFSCRTVQLGDGTWSVHHQGKDAGDVEVRAATREEAIEKIRNEIRYRLELCPCTGETYQHITIEIVES
jgi:hypothetical protein